MTPIEAEEIINKFWKSFKKLDGTKEIVQSISDLPCNQGTIKYALFVYGAELMRRNILPEEIGSKLSQAYADVDRLFDEEPDAINTEQRKYIDGLKRHVRLKDPRLLREEKATKDYIEYNNFLVDCQEYYRKKSEDPNIN